MKSDFPLTDGIVVAEVTLEDEALGQESSWKWLMEPKEIARGLDGLNDAYRAHTGEDLPFATAESRFRAAILQREREDRESFSK